MGPSKWFIHDPWAIGLGLGHGTERNSLVQDFNRACSTIWQFRQGQNDNWALNKGAVRQIEQTFRRRVAENPKEY